ncbi:hypothetical protein ACJMK2_039391 [Sinanodonta woodiana]|uniref:Phytanoyl-CoA dioxygenase family protein n=1 Tax=Sinanodonta woodiana TaxID=1069815 RepID=A0ABD3WFA6_SINWO
MFPPCHHIYDYNFRYNGDFTVTPDMKQKFDDYGYVIVRGLLDKEELELINQAIASPDGVLKHRYSLDDPEGRPLGRVIWTHPGNDITGVLARSEKVAGTSEQLLGGEVYHYHSKLLLKDAETGGRHMWHQDYGYWYHNGCLSPDMLTVFIPIDRCVKENGCLQILPGSHKFGRIEHVRKGIQEEADLERVEAIKQQTSLIYVEMDPGDAVFFHCNILHTSGPNNSNLRRWAFLTAYNKATNNPIKKHHHACYTPLIKVSNDAIRKCTVFNDLAGKEFIIPGTNSYIIKPTEEQQ